MGSEVIRTIYSEFKTSKNIITDVRGELSFRKIKTVPGRSA